MSADPGRFRPLLHYLVVVLVLMVFILVAVGGTVTSLGVGMAVPDWPGTFGYNMLLVPLDVWMDNMGVFWEHTHRLLGVAVGLTTLVLTGLLWRTERHRPWLPWLGILLAGLVIVQGLMGGFRVTENSVVLAAAHGVLGQIVLGTTVVVAAATGRTWRTESARNLARPAPQPPAHGSLFVLATLLLAGAAASVIAGSGGAVGLKTWSWAEVGQIWALVMVVFLIIVVRRQVQALRRVRPAVRTPPSRLRRSVALLPALLVLQLVLGAAVRHSGAASAIPDAPLVYGGLVPPTSLEGLASAVAALPPGMSQPPPGTDVGDVLLQYAHRVVAVLLLSALVWTVVAAYRQSAGRIVRLTLAMVTALALCQAALGLMVVWTGVYPSVATMHQAMGAALLASTVWATILVYLSEGGAVEAEVDL